jgi:hypothetical protein
VEQGCTDLRRCCSVLGAAATQTAGDPIIGKVLSLLAAVAAALTPILGKEILSLGAEAKWIRARATAEAIKSECFRFAAQAGDYAGADAPTKLTQRVQKLSAAAVQAQLAPLQDPVTDKGDKRRPSSPLDAKWHIANRIVDQIKFYRKKQLDMNGQ